MCNISNRQHGVTIGVQKHARTLILEFGDFSYVPPNIESETVDW